MNKRNIKIFVDFDGTITVKDVGEEIFKEFGEPEKVKKIIDDLLSDKISSRKCWDKLCKSAEPIDKYRLDNFIDKFEVDQEFKSFIEFCKINKIEIFVLSDGFDYYIDRVFANAGLRDINYYSNKLTIDENGLMHVAYPYYDSDSPTSANCKKNHIINCSSDDDYTIYIGDGNSDKEAAQYCDFIFAKNSLLKFCSKEKISFYPFNDFYDIKNKMIELLQRKNLKKRHQAELKRKAAYMAE